MMTEECKTGLTKRIVEVVSLMLVLARLPVTSTLPTLFHSFRPHFLSAISHHLPELTLM